jgi:hypothetical protein
MGFSMELQIVVVPYAAASNSVQPRRLLQWHAFGAEEDMRVGAEIAMMLG